MEINFLGYILFVFTGFLFGLFGAGGSMITIPILMWCFSKSFHDSTTYSLIIVFFISLLGVISCFKKKEIKFNSLIVFGISSLFGVFFSRNFLFHKKIIPEELLIILFIIILFLCGLLILIDKEWKFNYFSKKSLIIQGYLIGMLTGLLGIGGGFLIVPILIIFQNFNIKNAANSSIFLIFLNSFFAIAIDFSNSINIDWRLIFDISVFAIFGLFIGKKIQVILDLKIMKRLFALLLIVISLFFGYYNL